MRLLVCLSFLFMAGCRIHVIAPEHVGVVSGDLSFVCMPGEVCEIDVDSFDFEMKFYAIPAPGYSFLHWKNSPDHLCPGFFSDKCLVSTQWMDTTDEDFRTMLQSNRIVFLEPVYRQDEAAEGFDWDSLAMGDP